MSKVFVSSTLFWGTPLPETLRLVRQNGLAGLELWAQQFFLENFQEAEYLRYVEKYGLESTVHACSWDLNLASANAGIREASVQQVIRSLELASRIGAREVTVHPGHMTMVCWREESVQLLQQSLRRIAAAARSLQMPVSLEIMEKIKKEFVTDPASMEEVTGPLSSFFFYTLDLAHCDSTEEMETFHRTLPRISKLHISNRVGPQYHTPLPDGDYDFRALLPRLKAWDLPMVVEGYDSTAAHEVFTKNIHFLQEQGGIIEHV